MLAPKLGIQTARQPRTTTKTAWASPRGTGLQASSPQTTVEEMTIFYNSGVYENQRRLERSHEENYTKRIIDEVYDFKGEYANPTWRDIELPLGLKWVEAGGDLVGQEIINPSLAAALLARLDRADQLSWSGPNSALVFTHSEWEELKMPPLSRKSYIRVGSKYYRPFAVKKKSKKNNQEGRLGQICLLLSAAILLSCGAVIAVYFWAAQPLLDDTLAKSCMLIDFQCLDSNRDKCLTASEFKATNKGATSCQGNCTGNSSLPSFEQVAEASSSDGKCEGSVLISPADYFATPSTHGRSNRTLRCKREVLSDGECKCLTKDVEDCDCANTDVERLGLVWAQIRMLMWPLGIAGTTIFTGIPALISGIRHTECFNIGCYRTCAALCSALFLIVAILFLIVAMIIDSSGSRWNKNFGIKSCPPIKGPPPTTALGGEIDIVLCSKGGYCTLLETVGAEAAGRLNVIGYIYLVAGMTMSSGCVFCCAFQKSVPQPPEPEDDEEADAAPARKSLPKAVENVPTAVVDTSPA